MRPGLSTYVFLPQPLHTGLLDTLARACAPYGQPVIEIFAARHHFDYTERATLREVGTWFRDSGVEVALHQPLSAETQWSRHSGPGLNLIDPEKMRRIDAMDEVKRALESAEHIPFTTMVMHLGAGRDMWSPRSLENSLTAIEHLKVFAHPLGVKLLVENLSNEVATPEHLLEILTAGHFDNVGVCLDSGHAHLSEGGLQGAIELLKARTRHLHLHDNHGTRDEHLWPGEAEPGRGIGLEATTAMVLGMGEETPCILEISHELGETEDSVTAKASRIFSAVLREEERRGGLAGSESTKSL